MEGKRSRVLSSLGSAVTLSILGMAFHTIREFGVGALLNPASGFLPVTLVQVLLFVVGRLVPNRKALAALSLTITAIFQLIGGAIISVLPLAFLPFVPEQSLAHYLAHVVLGLTQIPLIVVGLRQGRARPVAIELSR